ncbi:hypothetical protein DUNSADRAFT_8238 [Dunaliella salina]|uniref:Ankyrin repeat domain-containing protein n=1 Tax=Dunaliella salina TaxID=3046 RepID=A0ABQ7HA42_DUNSA|nr:hypothetical protein DUNSADRAFT_8238 [Dunaliella salina]|eukprot:KAF5843723.1 hypothetical protein DUNSADRAFT_8238 [Dunaliella salina]
MPQKKGAKKKKKQGTVAQNGQSQPSQGLFCLKGAGPDFWKIAGDGQAHQNGELSVALAPAPLEAFLAWFEKGAHTGADNAHVTLVGSGKGERALVYSVIEARFPGLEAVSQGVGEDREVAVYIRGKAPKPTADENVRAQGIRLYKFAREAGLTQHSQDEIVERLATNTLTDELRAVWQRRAAEQEMLERLLRAVAQDDANCVKEICQGHPGIVNAAHIDNSELPLLVAARLNCGNAARALAEMGANLEFRCPSTNRTALKVARTFESTAVEAVLLQMGAHDPEAASFPIPNEQPTSLGNHPASCTESSEKRADHAEPSCTVAETRNTSSSDGPQYSPGHLQSSEYAQGSCSSSGSGQNCTCEEAIGSSSKTVGKSAPFSLLGRSSGLLSYSSTTWAAVAATAAAAGLGLVLIASLSRARR